MLRCARTVQRVVKPQIFYLVNNSLYLVKLPLWYRRKKDAPFLCATHHHHRVVKAIIIIRSRFGQNNTATLL